MMQKVYAARMHRYALLSGITLKLLWSVRVVVKLCHFVLTVIFYCLNCSVILARVLLLEITLNTKKFIFVGNVTITI